MNGAHFEHEVRVHTAVAAMATTSAPTMTSQVAMKSEAEPAAIARARPRSARPPAGVLPRPAEESVGPVGRPEHGSPRVDGDAVRRPHQLSTLSKPTASEPWSDRVRTTSSRSPRGSRRRASRRRSRSGPREVRGSGPLLSSANASGHGEDRLVHSNLIGRLAAIASSRPFLLATMASKSSAGRDRCDALVVGRQRRDLRGSVGGSSVIGSTISSVLLRASRGRSSRRRRRTSCRPCPRAS